MAKQELEQIVKGAKTALATAAIALTMYGCTGARVNSPLSDYTTARLKGEPANCTEVTENTRYGKNCIYPVVEIRF